VDCKAYVIIIRLGDRRFESLYISVALIIKH